MSNVDLISRSALKEEIESLHVMVTGLRSGKGVIAEYAKHYKESVLKLIDEAQTVEARPVVHAKWLPIGMRAVGLYSPTHYCSECKGHGFDYYDFCNNCGCDMRGGKND